MADPSLISKTGVSYARPTSSSRGGGKGMSILLLVAVVFFVGVGLIYGGAFLYRRNAERSLDGLTRELAQLEEDLDPEVINEIARVDRGLATARSLLSQHIYTSNLFDLLEEHTLESVYYSDFEYAQGQAVRVTGTADSYLSLHRQLERLRGLPVVSNVVLNSVSVQGQKENVGFAMNISFHNNLFRFR